MASKCLILFWYTLPKTNIFAPENRQGPKRKLRFQPSIFRGYVSFREGKLSNPTVYNTETIEIISSSDSEFIQQLFVVLMNIQTVALVFDVSIDNSLDTAIPFPSQEIHRCRKVLSYGRNWRIPLSTLFESRSEKMEGDSPYQLFLVAPSSSSALSLPWTRHL